ncbi:protein of unknown function [Lentzea xinjiangensis]|uniref:DUF4407 domain-containing protein n=1 Tax=Lentzea xinjiangensis TaxID=402600 RepID=A0A1H9MHL8_9PSEU|nr:DUF4407 domain-containing protein [Lentzea xinjiangensis]SER23192.1 protein of unknown function [Lentzea xinjiangensis]
MSVMRWLARLSGARADILQKAPGDLGKHAAMGGVLLSTAAVGALSAYFAMTSQLELPIAVAVAVAIGWGLVVFNLDRMLVVTMTRNNSKWLNFFVALPRVALAVVIGTVISVPLVLKIFEPEIRNELVVMQVESVQRNQARTEEALKKIKELEDEERGLLEVLSGRAVTTAAEDPDVKAAQVVRDNAEKTYTEAARLAQCEYDGSCGTRKEGDGEAYRQKKAVADEAKAKLDKAVKDLDETTARVNKRIADGASTATDAASRRLPGVQGELAVLREQAENLTDQGFKAAAGDTGLLARLEALDRITANRDSGGKADFMLFLLFLSIELLPVIVKLLSLFGKESLYDSLARRADEGADVDDEAWADRDRDIALLQAKYRFDEEQQRLAGQAAMRAQTSRAVADEQLKIAMNAIKVWSDLAKLRADEELDDWYKANVGHQGPVSTGHGIGRPRHAAHPNGATFHVPAGADPNATMPIVRRVNGSTPTPNP